MTTSDVCADSCVNRPLSYEYDVFISYPRAAPINAWRDYFSDKLTYWLGEQLGRDAKLFVDKNIPHGAQWPDTMARGLALSRITIPLLSKRYYASKWCVSEAYATIFKQGRIINKPIRVAPPRLLFPVALHDGEDPNIINRFPDITKVQYTDMRELFCTELSKRTKQRIDIAVKDWVQEAAGAIQEVDAHAPEQDWIETIASWNFRCPDPISFSNYRPHL